jgi:alpha-beta hydrolase superfamily lysophospholipase
MIDLKSHGLSYGERISKWVINESHEFIGVGMQMARKDRPLFVFAHSMGCMGLQTFLIKNAGNKDLERLSGIIF